MYHLCTQGRLCFSALVTQSQHHCRLVGLVVGVWTPFISNSPVQYSTLHMMEYIFDVCSYGKGSWHWMLWRGKNLGCPPHHCVTVYKDWQLHTTKNDSNLDTVWSFVMLVPGSHWLASNMGSVFRWSRTSFPSMRKEGNTFCFVPMSIWTIGTVWAANWAHASSQSWLLNRSTYFLLSAQFYFCFRFSYLILRFFFCSVCFHHFFKFKFPCLCKFCCVECETGCQFWFTCNYYECKTQIVQSIFLFLILLVLWQVWVVTGKLICWQGVKMWTIQNMKLFLLQILIFIHKT